MSTNKDTEKVQPPSDEEGNRPVIVERRKNPMESMTRCMTEFSKSFEASARRWELVVYPSLLAFILLAAYGFYLIYKLTNDVDLISNQFGSIAVSMHEVTQEMKGVTEHMSTMTDHVGLMTAEITSQNKVIHTMAISMENMNNNMSSMTVTMHRMQWDTRGMGHNMHSATGPMRFMNSFMPW